MVDPHVERRVNLAAVTLRVPFFEYVQVSNWPNHTLVHYAANFPHQHETPTSVRVDWAIVPEVQEGGTWQFAPSHIEDAPLVMVTPLGSKHLQTLCGLPIDRDLNKAATVLQRIQHLTWVLRRKYRHTCPNCARVMTDVDRWMHS